MTRESSRKEHVLAAPLFFRPVTAFGHLVIGSGFSVSVNKAQLMPPRLHGHQYPPCLDANGGIIIMRILSKLGIFTLIFR